MGTHGIRTAIVSGFAMFAMSRGLTMIEVLEAMGIEPVDLADAEGRIPIDAVMRLWYLLDERFPGVPHGLDAAALSPPSSWGLLNRATEHVPRLADAAEIYVRYTALISSASSARIVELEDGFGMQHEVPEFARELGHIVDYANATTQRHLFAGPARDHILRVELTHQPKGPLEAYHRAMGPNVLFGRPRSMTVVSHEGWTAARDKGDPAMLTTLRTLMDDMLGDTTVDSFPALEPVYTAIAKCAVRGKFAVTDVAETMGMSVRSLQRFAAEHDAQIGQLVELSRKSHAERLLADASLSVAEVAFLLGYSEERAFTRAFKRWTDRTPAQFRCA